VRRNVRRHEKNAGELAALARGARQRHVSAVDGIKGAAKQANIHARLVSSFAGPLGKFEVSRIPLSCYVLLDAWALADGAWQHCLFGHRPAGEKNIDRGNLE
jgi:hypothetical protein